MKLFLVIIVVFAASLLRANVDVVLGTTAQMNWIDAGGANKQATFSASSPPPAPYFTDSKYFKASQVSVWTALAYTGSETVVSIPVSVGKNICEQYASYMFCPLVYGPDTDYPDTPLPAITKITIPDTVNFLSEGLFFGLESLASLIVGSNVSILVANNDVFVNGCNALTAIYFRGDAPSSESNPFIDTGDFTIFRPATAAGWPEVPSNFWGKPTALWTPTYTIIPHQYGPPYTPIEDFTCVQNEGSITFTSYIGTGVHVRIPPTINNVPVRFISNSALTSGVTVFETVTLPRTIVSIGDNTFEANAGLTAVFYYGNCPSTADPYLDTSITTYHLEDTYDWPDYPDTWQGNPCTLWIP